MLIVLKKSITGLTLGLMLLFATGVYAKGLEEDKFDIVEKSNQKIIVEKSDGERLIINLDRPDFKDRLSDNLIKDIAEQADISDNVTIHDIIEPSSCITIPNNAGILNSKNNRFSLNAAQPESLLYRYEVTKKYTDRSPLAAQLIISVAYGETATLKSSITVTNSATISGATKLPDEGLAELNASLNASVTYTYEKGRTFLGPSKGYTSRQYYSTRFHDRGNYIVRKINRITGNVSETYTGTYGEPSLQDPIVNWSRDIK